MNPESAQSTNEAVEGIIERTKQRYDRSLQNQIRRADKLFATVFLAEWLFGILIAIVWSPYTWAGKTKVLNLHVWIAIFLGLAIISLPLLLIWKKSGTAATRYTVAVAQMLYSALLIHLTGGRIETHFHVFGSLALLAFYLDWGVLAIATITIALDHLIRGILWPESVYGILNPEWWRFLEHAFWVILCAASLIVFCFKFLRVQREAAEESGGIDAMLLRARARIEALEKEIATLKGT
ncbi:MAG: hypothetical protein WA001_01045 [Patescibacteria group bacterium]